ELQQTLKDFLGSNLDKEDEMIAWGAKRSPATYIDQINKNGAAAQGCSYPDVTTQTPAGHPLRKRLRRPSPKRGASGGVRHTRRQPMNFLNSSGSSKSLPC
ncbi:hypothetical protein E2651_42830, partial [Streptomyces sp. MZ04]